MARREFADKSNLFFVARQALPSTVGSRECEQFPDGYGIPSSISTRSISQFQPAGTVSRALKMELLVNMVEHNGLMSVEDTGVSCLMNKLEPGTPLAGHKRTVREI